MELDAMLNSAKNNEVGTQHEKSEQGRAQIPAKGRRVTITDILLQYCYHTFQDQKSNSPLRFFLAMLDADATNDVKAIKQNNTMIAPLTPFCHLVS